MKSLKKIIEQYHTSLNFENYDTDLHIVSEFLRENFNFEMLDYILLLFKDNASNLTSKVKRMEEHQGWNATTYEGWVLNKLSNDFEKYGDIQTKNWPYLTSLCMMHMDSGKQFEKVNPILKEIIQRVILKINDVNIKKWVNNKC